MRIFDIPPLLLCLTAALLIQSVSAGILPRLARSEDLPSLDDLQDVQKRGCEYPCGYYNQLCCPGAYQCYTDKNDEAQCNTANYAVVTTTTTVNGAYVYYVTTYTLTDYETVITSTIASWCPGTTASATTTATCQASQISCGSSCCNSKTEYCSYDQCVRVDSGDTTGYATSTITVTVTYTNSYTNSVPALATTQTTLTITGGSGTVPYQTPSPTAGGIIVGGQTSSSSHGLSGGAIAGIVIGVLVFIFLLLLICACCCAKEVIDGILDLFGLRSRKTVREETIVEERRSRRGGRRTWFGQGPSRTSVVQEKRDAGWGGFAGVAAFLGGLALLLGMKRRREEKDEKSDVSYSSAYYSDYTSASSASSAPPPPRTRRDSRSQSRR